MISSTQTLLTEARSYLGVRFRHQGTGHHGIDCKNLVVQCALHCGWEPRDPERIAQLNYPKVPTTNELREALGIEGRRIPNAEARVGDVALFHFEGADHPGHVGLISRTTGGALFYAIQADAKAGKVSETPLTGHWREWWIETYRFWEFCGEPLGEL